MNQAEKKGKTTPSFVHTFRIRTNRQEEKYLWLLSDCARQLQNNCTGEALKRLNRVRDTQLFKETLQIPKDTEENKHIRQANFKYLNEEFGFTNASMQSYAVKSKNDSKFIAHHLGVHVCQKIGTRAFKSVQKKAFGTAKQIHFKRKGEFVSFEGKNNATFLVYSNGYITVGTKTLKCLIDPKDKVSEYALKHRVKYCRIIHKRIKGKDRFYVQLLLEGTPFSKCELGKEETCIDVGPSSIAIVSDKEASLEAFCEKLPNLQQEKRLLQRRFSRQLYSNNPNNYNPDKTIKKGRKTWFYSNRMKQTKDKLYEIERRLAAIRLNEHGKKTNEIVRRSKKVKAEKLSYKAFQKLFGRSVNRCAPGMFVTTLENKMKRYGGKFQSISTYKTKLSQTCLCGKIEKKKLSTRWHRCKCGMEMQRDLFSAYLGKFTTTKNTVNLKKAIKHWNEMKPILDECIKTVKENKKNRKVLSSFGV